MRTSQNPKLFNDYEGFVEKFKPKKTTDDCYTPELVYEAVANWVSNEYNIKREDMVRPFYPGGDYENHDYPQGCAVVDNPPFSIVSKICKFYNREGVRFFLFAPKLTLFSSFNKDNCYIATDCKIMFENGAIVNCGFVTNMDEYAVRTAPDLTEIVNDAARQVTQEKKVKLPKYEYPVEIVTASRMSYLSEHGQDLKIRHEDCAAVAALDAQKPLGKTIYGKGLLLSKRAAAERAAAERAAAIAFELSDRERKIQEMLG